MRPNCCIQTEKRGLAMAERVPNALLACLLAWLYALRVRAHALSFFSPKVFVRESWYQCNAVNPACSMSLRFATVNRIILLSRYKMPASHFRSMLTSAFSFVVGIYFLFLQYKFSPVNDPTQNAFNQLKQFKNRNRTLSCVQTYQHLHEHGHVLHIHTSAVYLHTQLTPLFSISVFFFKTVTHRCELSPTSFLPSAESLSTHRVPTWFNDAKV